MSEKKTTFIKTSDRQTADLLISLGFKVLSNDGRIWTFLNDAKKEKTFEQDNKTAIVYSNGLCI